MAELAKEMDTYGAAVRQRQEKGDTEADAMVTEFCQRQGLVMSYTIGWIINSNYFQGDDGSRMSGGRHSHHQASYQEQFLPGHEKEGLADLLWLVFLISH